MSYQLYLESYDHLHRGDYNTGFRLFEYRWHPETQANFPKENQFTKLVSQPAWQGQNLYGASITVQMEMGYGDCIMFTRFLPYLKMIGVKKLVVLQTKSLHNLLGRMYCLDHISNNNLSGESVNTDYWVGSMSLPYYILHSRPEFRYLFPINRHHVVGREGYISVPPEQLDGRVKIGVNWEPSQNWGYNIRRLSEDYVARLNDEFPDVTFYSLNPKTAGPFRELPDNGWREDWSKTAGYIASMNAVITIDTATVHMAGALGIPTLMMNPEDKYICWRWRFPNWYQSVTTFGNPGLEEIIKYLKETKHGNHILMAS
jgi:hypothetical protein